MTTVDVTKLACEFIRQVEDYSTQVKYLVNPCLDDIQYYFSKYKLATSLEDCLTHEDECELEIIASTIPIDVPDDPIITTCSGLAEITLSKVSVDCVYTTSLRKLSGVASSFPDVVLSEDDITQSSFIEVVTTGCSESITQIIDSGCRNITNNTPPTCSDTYNSSLNIYYNMEGLQNHSSGYIKTLRIYQTDATGMLINTPIDLNLAPSNLAAWTACGLCSGISAGDLYFGSANWASAFKELLDNVVYTLQGSLESRWLVSKGTFYLSVGNTVKHNPASEWYGINKDDFRVEWVNNLNKTITITSPNSTGYTQTLAYMAEDFTLATLCGNVTGRVIMNNGVLNFSSASNFNHLELNNLEINSPASIVNLVTPTCTKTTLTATFTTSVVDPLYYWTDSDDNVISEELSVIVTASGDYTFNVQVSDGCVSSETITVV